jgi:hypothetical protein
MPKPPKTQRGLLFMNEITETKRRFYVEDVAAFVESILPHQPRDQQEKWAHLPSQIRAHPFPFFYVPPSRRIVECVRFASSSAPADAPRTEISED